MKRSFFYDGKFINCNLNFIASAITPGCAIRKAHEVGRKLQPEDPGLRILSL